MQPDTGRECFTGQEPEAGREVICPGSYSKLSQNLAQCGLLAAFALVSMGHAAAGVCRRRTAGFWHLSVIPIY